MPKKFDRVKVEKNKIEKLKTKKINEKTKKIVEMWKKRIDKIRKKRNKFFFFKRKTNYYRRFVHKVGKSYKIIAYKRNILCVLKSVIIIKEKKFGFFHKEKKNE